MRLRKIGRSGPAETVRQAVGSLRLMGGLFLGLAVLLGLMAIATGGPRGGLPAGLVAASAVLLAGPGVLYQVTAVRIRRHDLTVARLARRTALAQSALAVAAVAVLALGMARQAPLLGDVTTPAIVTLFFVPALLAQAYEIGTALEALRHLPQAQRGFEVQPPMPVLPVDDGDHP